MSQQPNINDNQIKHRIQLYLYSFLVFLWMIVIFAFSSQRDSAKMTSSVFGIFDFVIRKCAHMCEFGLLFILCFLAIRASQMIRLANSRQAGVNTPPKKRIIAAGRTRAIIIAATISILYAMSDEWHQTFVPGRSPAVQDVLIDTAGILIAFFLLPKKQRQPRQNHQ